MSNRIPVIIDDDAEACEIIRRLLEKDGFRVATALSGEDGLRLAHQLQPAAITLDVMMPDMDGWSVLRALKADPDLRDVPVVMLTMVDDKSKGYSLGATDYLTKPVDRAALERALREADCVVTSGGGSVASSSRPACLTSRSISTRRSCCGNARTGTPSSMAMAGGPTSCGRPA